MKIDKITLQQGQCVGHNLYIQIGKYANGRDSISLLEADGQPFTTASVNLVDMPCEEHYTYIKNYSENEGMFEELVRLGIVEDAEETQRLHPLQRSLYGFPKEEFPYVKININSINDG